MRDSNNDSFASSKFVNWPSIQRKEILIKPGRGCWIAFHDAALAKLGGTWYKATDNIAAMGFNAIFPRAGYNGSRQNDWNPIVAKRVVNICKTKDIDVYPWYYSTPKDLDAQVSMIKGLLDDGVAGVIIDAEIEYDKDPHAQDFAFELGSKVRATVGDAAFIGSAPWPFRNYHLSYPYSQFAGFCDSCMIQAYWTGGGYQRMATGAFPQWRELMKQGSPIAKGLAPIGCTYGSHSAYPQGTTVPFDINDLADFCDYWKDLPFLSFYSIEAAEPGLFEYFQPDLSTNVGKQIALRRLGFYKDKIDGAWGPNSEAATKTFQEAKGLTADGVFGPETAKCMWLIQELHCK